MFQTPRRLLCKRVVNLVAGGCTSGYMWSMAIPNTSVSGGTANGATSVSACQMACSASTNCMGIDWVAGNVIGQQCFLVYTTTSGPRNNGTAIGVTHYDYVWNNCNSTLRQSLVTPFVMYSLRKPNVEMLDGTEGSRASTYAAIVKRNRRFTGVAVQAPQRLMKLFTPDI
jgi:hypothetical protein